MVSHNNLMPTEYLYREYSGWVELTNKHGSEKPKMEVDFGTQTPCKRR
jgi:hypothetical protein